MVNNPTPNEIDLEAFLRAAGQSFTDAQKSLVSGLDVPVNMALSDAELELKVAVSSDAEGKMAIRPISSEDLFRGGIDPGMLSTVRVRFVTTLGEIKPPPVPTGDITGRGNTVPALVGLTLDEAVKLLQSAGWQFEVHAASIEEIKAAEKGSLGHVTRQQPTAGQLVDKAKTTVHFWVDLGNVPVTTIDGIGVKYADSLSKIGINSVGELSLSNVNQVASALRISEPRARVFVDMANLMCRLAILGFKDEVVELLVRGANIRSVEQLAESNSKELYATCREAVSSGKVRVPSGFRFTAAEVTSWIKIASGYLNK